MTQKKELVDEVTGRVKIEVPMKRKKGDRKHKSRHKAATSQAQAVAADNNRNSMIDLSQLNVSHEELNSIIEKHSQTSLKIELRKETKTEVASEINANMTKSLGIWGSKATSRRDTSKRRKRNREKSKIIEE